MKESKFYKVISTIMVVCGLTNAVSFVLLGAESLIVFYSIVGITALIAVIAFIQVVNQENYHEDKPFNFWVGLGAAAAVILVIAIFTVGIFPEYEKVILPVCMGFYPFIIPMGGAFFAMMWRSLTGRPLEGLAVIIKAGRSISPTGFFLNAGFDIPNYYYPFLLLGGILDFMRGSYAHYEPLLDRLS